MRDDILWQLATFHIGAIWETVFNLETEHQRMAAPETSEKPSGIPRIYPKSQLQTRATTYTLLFLLFFYCLVLIFYLYSYT